MDYKAKLISLINDESLPIEQRKKLNEIYNSCIESEDERIKREIVRYINLHKNDEGKRDEWIAWLEKQPKDSYFLIPEESLGISSEKYNEIVDKCIFGEQKQVDGFDAELNVLLKKYEHLPKEEIANCVSFYIGFYGIFSKNNQEK